MSLRWVNKRSAEVLRDWRDDKVGAAETARRLYELGWSIDDAWRAVSK